MTDISHILDQLIKNALNEQASDIHIQPYPHEYRVRLRCDGMLTDFESYDIQKAVQVCARIKVLSQLDVAEKRRPQDGTFLFSHDRYTCDIRVATFPSLHGEKVVLRLLDRSEAPKTLQDLGLECELQQKLLAEVGRDTGSIILTGPTGSGKTTTAHALLRAVNSVQRNVVTLEDPIEYLVPGATQMAIQPALGITFDAGLRALLRQDPDVILVGEIRDAETARVSMQAALTGHLVVTTMHTNDAPSALVRLLHLGCESYLVAAAVRVVIAQRLLRTNCEGCVTRVPVEDHEVLLLKSWGYELDYAYKGVGCSLCRGTGFKGRTGIFQMLVLSRTIRSALMRSVDLVAEQAAHEGMKSLVDDAYKKVCQGYIPLSEWSRIAMSL